MAIKVKKVLAEIGAGNGRTIKLQVVENEKGDKFLDLRQWEDNERYSGPTKKGVWLDAKVISEIRDSDYLGGALEEIQK